MNTEVDHYAVLGLPSGAGFSEQEIHKAYILMARELHPDKRPDDPDAHAKFLKLKESYEILKTGKGCKSRKKPDDRQGQYDSNSNSNSKSKRRRMMSDLEKRERSAAAAAAAAQEEEKRVARRLKQDINRIVATLEKGSGGGESIPLGYKEEKVLKPLALILKLNNPAAGFKSFEDIVLDKLRKRGAL